jgi:hypothetical protein
MKMIVFPAQISELRSLPKNRRNQAWRQIYGLSLGHWEVWAALAACIFLVVTGDAQGRTLLAPYLHSLFAGATVGAVTGALVGGLIFTNVVIYVARKYHSDALHSLRDISNAQNANIN